MRLAGRHPEWALGFNGETWWSWTTGEPLRLIEQVCPKGDREPKAFP
jgi:hypothetical protein